MGAVSFSTSSYTCMASGSCTTPPFSSAIFFSNQYSSASVVNPAHASSVSFRLKPPPDSSDAPSSSALSGNLRRPDKSLRTTVSPSSQQKPQNQNPSNPLNLKNPLNSNHVSSTVNFSHSVANKLRLSSKLTPPPPPPPPPPSAQQQEERGNLESHGNENLDDSDSDSSAQEHRFRQQGKIFVGNLPSWIKKNEVAEFFRQFGPIKHVILIKGHHDTDRNAGFGFVVYGGPAADNSAMKAVEFDGVEFHGRILTVKLDDGRRLREKSEERVRWVEGGEGVEYRSKWHEEREGSRLELRKILETEPENWQAVVRAFERIKKVEYIKYALLRLPSNVSFLGPFI